MTGAAGNLYAGDGSVEIVKMDTIGNQTVFSSGGNLSGTNNRAGASYVAFSRLSYSFSGFLPPVANPPEVNNGVAGRTYPIKWQLKNSSTGAIVSTLSAITSVTFESVNCGDFTGDPGSSLPTTASAGSNLRYDTGANQYIYNWATPAQAGCYDLFLTLDTGQVFTAQFTLR
ncbi:MAG: hypothetical protein C5B58_14165 [Acidobacteria bacterium]|nr:MAG: hypothetical protein C5B58_14165 [Acidobacteriota bacterium]